MSYSTNINYGTLLEVPQIRIDNFRLLPEDWNKNEAFFLSHGHTDHMVDLDWFLEELAKPVRHRIKHTLYMHKVTLEHVKYHFKRTPCKAERLLNVLDELQHKGQLRLLKKNLPYRFIFSTFGNQCWVTCLSAGHSPGSLMFLIETSTKRILFTADCRVQMDDLRFTAALHEPGSGNKIVLPIDVLYVDTTFMADEEKEFPSRRDVFNNISTRLTDKNVYDENAQFMLNMAGHLTQMYLVRRIVTKWRDQICVHQTTHEFAESIPLLKGTTVAFCDYENKENTLCPLKFHLKTKRNGKIPDEMIEIKLAATCPPSSEEVEENITELEADNDNDTVIQSKGEKCLHPERYSMHLSPNEIVRLVRYLKPERVYPLVIPKIPRGQPKIQIFDIQKRLDELLTNNPVAPPEIYKDVPSFQYDLTGDNDRYKRDERNTFYHV